MEFFFLLLIVSFLTFFFKRPIGRKISKYLPVPFWVYFIPIVFGSFGLLPSKSPSYSFIGLHFLPAALFLLLIGSPLSEIRKLGPKASLAMVLGMGGMVIGGFLSFLICFSWLPENSFKSLGTLLGTWTGGSANMVSVKEIVDLSDGEMAPLILVDTFLSYGWLALLLLGTGLQVWFDKKVGSKLILFDSGDESRVFDWQKLWILLLVGFLFGEMAVFGGSGMKTLWPLFSAKAWAIILATTMAVLLALSPLSRIEKWGASALGTFLLYLVLASIGAKTTLAAVGAAPVFLLFGGFMLLFHGIILFGFGRLLKIPLFLLATASQANVGGPVSAPIVAGTYKPGAAPLGVLMAILGAILGTYVGVLGSWGAKALDIWMRSGIK